MRKTTTLALTTMLLLACSEGGFLGPQFKKGANGGGGGGNGGGGTPPTWTSDLDLVVTAEVGRKNSKSNAIYVASSTDPNALIEIFNSGTSTILSKARWFPDGQGVVFGVHNFVGGTTGVYVVRRQADDTPSSPIKLFDLVPGPLGDPAFSPDGEYLAYVESQQSTSTLYLREVIDLQALGFGPPIPVPTSSAVYEPSWSGDSRSIVVLEPSPSSCDGNPCTRGAVVTYELDPDGNGIFDQVNRFDVNTNTPLRNLATDPRWSPIDDHVVGVGWPIGGGPFNVHFFDFSNQSQVIYCELTNTLDSDQAVAYSSDGTSLAVRRASGGNLGTSIIRLDLGSIDSSGCPAVSESPMIPARGGGGNPVVYRDIDWR